MSLVLFSRTLKTSICVFDNFFINLFIFLWLYNFFSKVLYLLFTRCGLGFQALILLYESRESTVFKENCIIALSYSGFLSLREAGEIYK